jgi:hypothetical protein
MKKITVDVTIRDEIIKKIAIEAIKDFFSSQRITPQLLAKGPMLLEMMQKFKVDYEDIKEAQNG